MMSLFPADRPLSRTWSMVTQMAWETAKVSRPTSLLSFLRFFLSPLLFLFSLLTCSPFSLRPPFSSSSPVTSSSPVCSALTILSFSFFHPSVPFGSHPPLSFSRWVSGPPVNRVLCPIEQRLDSFLKITRKTQPKHSETHKQRLLLVCNHRAYFETQTKSQSASKVLNGLVCFAKQRITYYWLLCVHQMWYPLHFLQSCSICWRNLKTIWH